MTKIFPLLLGTLATLIIAPACSSEAPELLYKGQPILRATDMHLHTGEWSILPPRTKAYLASRFPFPFSLTPEKFVDSALSASGILNQLDTAGLERAVLLAVYAPKSVGITKNESMIAAIEEAPGRLFGLASLAVDNWNEDENEELDQLAQALKHPQVIGIKLAHAHQHFAFDDPRFYSIYQLAEELQSPIYLHTGSSPFPGTLTSPEFTNPAFLEEAIAEFSETTFILGHLGYDFTQQDLGELETCLQLAKRYPNVFLEQSAMGSAGADPSGELYAHSFRRIKEEGLIDRLIYGSDGPQYPGFVASYLSRSLDAMLAADFTSEEVEAVLATNFNRVFGVSP